MRNAIYIFTITLFTIISSVIYSDDFSEDDISINNFKMQEFSDQTGLIVWKVKGKTAKINGDITRITDTEIILPQNKLDVINADVHIMSPQSVLNQTLKILKSDGPIHIVSRNMIVNAVGYQMNIKKQKIFLLSNVKVKILGFKHARKKTNDE